MHTPDTPIPSFLGTHDHLMFDLILTLFSQALQTYYHIQAALEHLRPVDLIGHPAATGQPYRSLVDCASNAVGMLSGRIPAKPLTHLAHHHHHHHQRPMGLAGSEPKRMRMGHFGDKDKPATYCRGCGATETPEWRRGPLGPRTLCNACVSLFLFFFFSRQTDAHTALGTFPLRTEVKP
jgi:hypothetical protein